MEPDDIDQDEEYDDYEDDRCPNCGEVDTMEKIPQHLGGGMVEWTTTCVFCGHMVDD